MHTVPELRFEQNFSISPAGFKLCLLHKSNKSIDVSISCWAKSQEADQSCSAVLLKIF